MRRWLLMLSISLFGLYGYAEEVDKQDADQSANVEKKEKTLFQFLTLNESGGSKKLQVILHMQGGYAMDFVDGNLDEGAFRMKQLRFELKGDLNNWLSYRYRQRLNRSNDGSGSMDNLPGSIDVAGIGLKLSDKWSLFAGKQCAAYGGIEFDINPVEIYQYSDMIDNMSNFMTGVNVSFKPNPKHELNFQILNSKVASLERTYGVSPEIEAAKLPLVYTLNWNGQLMDWLSTRWSASYMTEAKNKDMYYFALGNQVQFKKFGAFLDVMYSREGIDRKGIITQSIGSEGHNAFNASYCSLVLQANYFINNKWNLLAKGMYETASIYKDYDDVKKGHYRSSYGYMGGVEFYPMADNNLHFFLMGVGRSYDYTEKAKALKNNNFSTLCLEVGLVYKLPVF
ncbi:MAG: porin [Phocaeicola sp.]